VTGDGPYAVLSECTHGGHHRRPGLIITLWGNFADAEGAKAFIDETGCGGMCSRQHRIVVIDHDSGTAVGSSAPRPTRGFSAPKSVPPATETLF
jgi:hypothetical protein